MNADNEFRVILVTAPDVEVGRQVARAVLDARLVACVNIVPKIESLYWWKGEIQSESEVLLVMKTKTGKINHLEAAVKAAHPYEIPEFVVLPIAAGSPDYLKWITDSVQ